MPPKKKPRNAFLIFMIEYKEKEEKRMRTRMDMVDVQRICGAKWQNMTDQEKGPYVNKAKNEKITCKQSNEKYTSTGIPLSFIENEKREKDTAVRLDKKRIADMVQSSFANNTYADRKYFFIHINYFARSTDGKLYIPAELAISCYSLKDGVINTHHTYINPGSVLFGHAYEAAQYAKLTHKLPLPPNAFGEKNLGKVFQEILNFLKTGMGGNDYPPVFTDSTCLEVVKSSLEYMEADYGEEVNLKVLPIQYLFYQMDQSVMEKTNGNKSNNEFMLEAIFERDVYDYKAGLSCEYHEEADVTKYCSLSIVTRWGYQFSDKFVHELAIPIIKGRHLPDDADLTFNAPNKLEETFSDTESYVSQQSYVSSSSNFTQPKIEKEDLDSSSSTFVSDHEFPVLGGARKKKLSVTSDKNAKEVERKNPWVRSGVGARLPNEESFYFSNVVSGRGRGIAPNNDTASVKSSTSFGRGRYFHQD